MLFLRTFYVGILVTASVVPFSSVAVAAGAGITYHGRLLKPDGTPVTASTVHFKLQIRTPGPENCLLYEEQQTKNLSTSLGIFAITINDGTANPVNTEPFTLDRVFQNRGTFTFAPGKCSGALTYSPGSMDGRKLVVEFNDGSGWEPIPAQDINHVPMALESMTVGGFSADNLLRVEEAGVPEAILPLSHHQHETLLDLIAGTSPLYRAGSGSNVTSVAGRSGAVTLGTADLSDFNSAADARITAVVGSWKGVANGLASLDAGGKIPASQLPALASGTVSSVDVAVPAFMTSTGGPVTSSGTVTLGFASQNQHAVFAGPLAASGAPSFRLLRVSDLHDASGLGGFLNQSGACPTGQALGHNAVADTLECQAVVTSSAVTAALGFTPANSTALAGYLPLSGGTMSGPLDMGANNIVNVGAIGIGTATPASLLHVAGGVQIGADGATCNGTKAGTLRYNLGNVEYCNGSSWAAFGISGAGITAFNGSSQATQSLGTPGTGGTAPNWSTNIGTGVHTLNIPMASSAGTLAGLLSKSEYDALNGKLGAVAGSPLPNGQIWVGNGSNQAVAVTPSGDATMTNTGSIVIAKIRGNAVSNTAPGTDGQVLRWNNSTSQWEPSTDGSALTALNAANLSSGTLPAARLPAFTGGDVTSSAGSVVLTLANSGVTNGTYTKVTVDVKGRVTAGANLASGDVTGALGYTPLNKAGDVMGGVLGIYNTASDPAGLTAGDKGKIWFNTTGGQLKYWDGAAAQAVSSASGSVAAVTASAPLSSSGGTSPNLSIAKADASTDGFLSKTDWAAFNSKLAAVSNSASLANGKMWIGDGTGKAQEVTMSGDVTISNLGAATVGKILGKTVSASPTAAGQVLRYDGVNYTPGFVAMTDLRSSVTGTNAFASSCSASQTLVYNSVGDTMSCASIAISNSQVSGLGALATKSAVDLSTTDATGILAAARFPALTGDVTTVAGALATTLTNNAVTTAKINNLAVTDAKINDVAWSKLTGKPTTLGGYGITDAVIKGGQAGAVSLGPQDANALSFLTSNVPRMTIDAAGNVGIGTAAPAANVLLDTAGAIRSANTTTNTTSVDFAKGNTQFFSGNCAANVNLTNMVTGTQYTLVVTDTNVTQCTFQDGGTAVPAGSYMPANGPRISGKRTIYQFVKVSSTAGDVLVSWSPGFQ